MILETSIGIGLLCVFTVAGIAALTYIGIRDVYRDIKRLRRAKREKNSK